MAETDLHRDDMVDLIESLKMYFAGQKVYVSGNILLFYEPGNRRRHLSPDVLVTKNLEQYRRKNYLIWKEGKQPDVIIEVTSQSTKEEDIEDKFELYQDTIKVPEYFLFDPEEDYLEPSLQGHRLVGGRYVAIEFVDGRLPSAQLGLHLERHGPELRLYNPVTKLWLPTPAEARQQAEAARKQEAEARSRAEAEVDRLRRELDRLRPPSAPPP